MDSDSVKISCIVHTHNSESTIRTCLSSVAWANELIVVDMKSADHTLDIVKEYTKQVFSCQRVPRVDGIRNLYLEKAAYPWLLVLDSDEYLADDGERLVRGLIEEHGDKYDAFSIPRYNFIAGQVMRGSGWYPDHLIRLFRKGTVVWEDAIHIPPRIITGFSRLMILTSPDCLHLHHTNYRDLTHFIQKQLDYALNDVYATDEARFDFSEYLAQAYEELAKRADFSKDGDLSTALSLIMAWDKVIRGLIHWDRLQGHPSLNNAFAMPIVTTRLPYCVARDVPLSPSASNTWEIVERLRRLEDIENSLTWRLVSRFLSFVDKRLFPQHTLRGRFAVRIYEKIRKLRVPKKSG